MIPEPLLEDISGHRCLLFIGAGFSLNAKLTGTRQMPDWEGLINELKRILETEETNPLKITSEYSRRFGKTKLIQKINSLLHVDYARPGKVHQKLVKIDFDTIYTTNFEYLLEQAFHQEKKPIITIVNDTDIGLYSPRTHTNIIKMHGDLSHTTELTITEEDYNLYLKKHPIISTHLSDMFATRTTLFIGYSLSDPHLNHIRKIIRKRLGEFQLKPYIIKFDATEKEIGKYENENFNVINLETKGKSREDCLLEFLDQVSNFVNVKAVGATMTDEDKGIKFVEQKLLEHKTKYDAEQFSGEIIRKFAELEVQLRTTLEKFGLDETEIKKPINSIVKHAVNLGLVSPSDVNLIRKAQEIRNEVAHSTKNITKNEVIYIDEICNSIINKIQKIEKPSRQIIIELSPVKDFYEDGETLVISGKVNSIIPSLPVTITILNPLGHLVSVLQLFVHENHFEASIITGGALWTNIGRYTIRALYGHETNYAETTFTFKRTEDLTKIKTRYSFPIKALSGKIISISYLLRGNSSLRDIITDSASSSLIIVLQGNSEGELWIILPRTIIDAREENKDVQFFVLTDGVETTYTEKSTINERELIIPFNRGTSTIEILGTHLFGIQGKIGDDRKIVSILEGSSAPRDDEKYLNPQTLIIDVGETIEWINEDNSAHTITSGTPESGPDGIFDGKLSVLRRQFSHTFAEKGTYRYFCAIHPWKEGKIIVK